MIIIIIINDTRLIIDTYLHMKPSDMSHELQVWAAACLGQRGPLHTALVIVLQLLIDPAHHGVMNFQDSHRIHTIHALQISRKTSSLERLPKIIYG